MGKRTFDLDNITIGELTAILNTVVLSVDDPSFSGGEAKELKLKDILLADAMDDQQATLDNETNVITPKSFKATVASETVTGVAKVASNANLTGRSTNNVLVAAKLLKIMEAAQDVYHVTGSPSQGVSNCDIRFVRQGQLCFMTGRFTFDFTIWGAAAVAAITFSGVPDWAKPVTKSAVAAAFDVQGPVKPLNGNIRNVNASDIRIDCFAQTTLSGSSNIVVQSVYYAGETV